MVAGTAAALFAKTLASKTAVKSFTVGKAMFDSINEANVSGAFNQMKGFMDKLGGLSIALMPFTVAAAQIKAELVDEWIELMKTFQKFLESPSGQKGLKIIIDLLEIAIQLVNADISGSGLAILMRLVDKLMGPAEDPQEKTSPSQIMDYTITTTPEGDVIRIPR